MSEHDEFIVESENPELKACSDELTGWESVVFQLADEEADAE